MKKQILFIPILLSSFFIYAQKSNPKVNSIWKDHIDQFTQEIESLDSDDYSDLEFLKPILEDKQYVFLGESSHEVVEYYELKNRLVQFLYKEMGYTMMAIEGYKLVCMETNQIKNEISIDSLYTHCFPYQRNHLKTKGVDSILSFIQNSEIKYNGFDIDLEFPYRFLKIVKKIFPLIPDSTLSLDSELTLNYKKAKGLEFKAWDTILNDSLIFPQNTIEQKEAYQAILHRRNWLYKMPVNNPHNRDSIMGRNILDLITKYYPNEKIIFWAHNWHISKYNPDYEVMGEYIPDSIREKSYVLGLYAFQGTTGVRKSGEVELVKHKKNSLGAILNSAGYDIVFADFSQQTHKPENSWMFEKIPTVSWAFQRHKIIPSKRYDGIIQIKNITATRRKDLNYEDK